MKYSIIFGIAVATPLAGAAIPAKAQDFLSSTECRLEMRVENSIDWQGLYGRGYEVFEKEESFEVANVTIRHEGAACDWFLTGASETGGGSPQLFGPYGTLVYDVLHTPNGPSLLSPDYTGNQFSRLRGRFGAGAGAQQVTLYIAIPPDQYVGGGSYSGQAILRLFRDDLASPELADQSPLGIIAPVASVLKVESMEAGPGVRTLNVDLGNLEPGADRTLDFSVRSNALVRATVQSANRGKLTHRFGAPGIPYRLAIGDRLVDLTGTTTSEPIAEATPTDLPVPFHIAVDPQPGAAAGNYTDTLTITFIVDG